MKFKSKNNKRTKAYLDFYLKQKNPGYAVLLTGPWGCGKTWFAKNYFNLTQWKEISVHFSVAGCSNVQEIDRKMLYALMGIGEGDKWSTYAENLIEAGASLDN